MSATRLGKYACLEVERRYLLRELPPFLVGRPPHYHIVDIYVPDTRLRLRQMRPPNGGDVIWKLTQKFVGPGQGALETTITNLYLDEREYNLLGALGGREIVKDRHIYLREDRRYGVDVFRGPLAGLILAETEFDTLEEARSHPIPEFADVDVTDDPAFCGGSLCHLSTGELQQLLSENRAHAR